jgi:hypothetical protein
LHSPLPSVNPLLVTVTSIPYAIAAGFGDLHWVINTPPESVCPISVVVPLAENHPPPDLILTFAPLTGVFCSVNARTLISTCPPAGIE